ncbi:MAG: hypothetical protein M0R22_09010 [Dehalococcoidia bacterium]|jgi:hypothetical protein|nr:hypothetical protein [Dehalococcoidia bacterium]
MTGRRASCGARSCGVTTRRRVLRLLLLGALLGLALMATGCQSVLKDILSGDECGDHAVCERNAAAAGAGAAVAGAAAAYVQKKQDNPSEPWPWEKPEDEAEMDAELEELAKGKKVRLKMQEPEELTEPLEEPEEETKSKKKEPEKPAGPVKDKDGTKPAKQEEEPSTEPVEEQEETTSDSEETTDKGKEEEKDQETPSVEVEKPDRGKDKKKQEKPEEKKKVKAPAEKYVPVTSVGDVTVLVDPATGKVAIGGGRFIGGKDENGYWLTQDGKVVLYNERTRNATVTDGVFTLEKEGKSYTLTSGNKLLSSDGKGGFEVSDGHFTVARDGSAFGITKDNKVVAYDRASGDFVVSDGRFTAEHTDKSYTLTKDNKVITFDRATGNVKISDGHYVLQRENSVTVFTKDKVQLTYNERAGTGSVKVWGQKGELKVGAGREGSWLVDGKVKGSIDGTPTTFKVSAEQYRLPDAGQRGFRGGVDIQQKDRGLTLTYGKDDVSRTFSADVRNRDWTVGFSRAGDNETYRAGWRNVFVSYGRESGGSATMAGYTRKF